MLINDRALVGISMELVVVLLFLLHTTLLSLSHIVLCHIFYHISYMDNFKNNKSTMGDAAKKEHTFMIQNDASPSKFQHKKMGVSLALLTKKIFNK